MLADLVRGYYEAKWGAPNRIARFDAFGHTIEIYKWEPDATGEEVTIYATNGASASRVLPGGHRVEFFVGFHPEFDGIAPALSLLATYPLQEGDLRPGDTVTMGDPLWAGAPASTFLIVPQIEELLEPLLLPDASHVQFCEVLPISETELEIKRQRGAVWLLGDLNDRGIATWEHQRAYL
ncbi:suppressor of fused domain protein [Actinoplanes subtropicus]|uniref:suppressor of fused domain protein n=1 Tax=Actinoplanes subtropicus TaxID=543632 RepID=UPI0009FE613D|nr:suppressor of fused domain protein [Actinoplanes subtropicus]